MWEEEGKTAVCDFYGIYEVSADTTTTAHPSLPDGGKACFAVSAFDEESNSASSETVSATELDMTPSVPTPEGSPLTLTVPAAAGSDDNHLSWYGLDPSAPEQAGGYRIHRWNQDTSAYETVAEVIGGIQEFIDRDARRGTPPPSTA
ncbi:hypothetical protein [Streptomyces sp. NPDC000618]|uniref:hypothetical protein n=1 Tax=Streptomyces sp. NPDC000618 TaxID=3154265 RepID=UPI00331AA20E